MDFNKDIDGESDRLDKLFRYVHARMEEKFKGFR
jgi:Ca2+-binding EF-hand superfamily protein